jgi:hypothetical protein
MEERKNFGNMSPTSVNNSKTTLAQPVLNEHFKPYAFGNILYIFPYSLFIKRLQHKVTDNFAEWHFHFLSEFRHCQCRHTPMLEMGINAVVTIHGGWQFRLMWRALSAFDTHLSLSTVGSTVGHLCLVIKTHGGILLLSGIVVSKTAIFR